MAAGGEEHRDGDDDERGDKEPGAAHTARAGP
jgi:hypothetical protein